MKRDTSGNEFMTRYAILLHMACNTDRMVMKWCIIGHEFITVGMDLAQMVIQTQVSGRRFMTMCTIFRYSFVHICPCRHDNVNCLQWWPVVASVFTTIAQNKFARGGQAACFRLSPTPSDVLRWVVSMRLPTRPCALSAWAGSIHSRRLTPGAVGCTPHLSAAQRNDVSMEL